MKQILSFFFILFTLTASAQTRFSGPKVAIGYQGRYGFIELGYIKALAGSQAYAASASSEFNFNGGDKRLYVGPKLSLEYYHFIKWYGPGLRLSMVDHTDFKSHDPYFLPEALIHVIAVGGIGYGYNIRLGQTDLLLRPTHRVHLFLNMVKSRGRR